MLLKFLKSILTLAAIGAIILVFYTVFGGELSQLYDKYFPCKRPVVYTIGSFDTEFGLSKNDFLESTKEAEMIWEKSLGKDLFVYDTDENTKNDLQINLVYDFRQEATNKIKTLASNSTGTRASYDALKLQYDAKQKDYLKAKEAYNQKVSAFKIRQSAYMKKVDYWNSRGGAPKDDYEEMKTEEASLNAELANIRRVERELNEQVAEVNDLVSRVNSLAKSLNLNVEVLNNINEKRGEEFTEGEYIERAGSREIDIYEFNNHDKLVRLLAHELGHALGLDHVENPGGIMYYLNENKTGKLTTDDLNAIKNRCGIM